MIIACSPLRISIGGGGTDLPSYYRRNGGEERSFHGGNGHTQGDPELAEPHSLVAAKLLSFRPVSLRESPVCSH